MRLASFRFYSCNNNVKLSCSRILWYNFIRNMVKPFNLDSERDSAPRGYQMRTKRNNLLQNSKPLSNRYVRLSMLDNVRRWFGADVETVWMFPKLSTPWTWQNIAANTVLKRIRWSAFWITLNRPQYLYTPPVHNVITLIFYSLTQT